MTHTLLLRRLAAVAFLICIALPFAKGAVEVNINENGKIISFYDQYYVYQLNGTVTIENPSNYSLYNVEIPLYLSTLDVRTNNTGNDNYMNAHKIYLYSLDAGETERFHYSIIGISTENLASSGESVLANAITALQPKIYSNLFGTLKKAKPEDPAYTGRSARLISVEIRNPTDFEYTINNVQVIKTVDNDPNAVIKSWSFNDEKSSLAGGEGWDFDFIDINITEGEIYWLTTDIYIDQVTINATANITRYTQDDLFEIIANATVNDTILEDDLSFLTDRVYIRKFASKTLVNPGDIIDFTIVVNNFEPDKAYVQIQDTLPTGFDLITVKEGNHTGNNVTWEASISSGNVKRFTYQARYTDEDGLGVDYFRPAQLLYDGSTYYSQSIPFVRKYVPEKRVFVQKNVKFLSGEEVQVTLIVQNLGESSLQDLVVKEHLLSSAEFREISVQPEERGVWKIENLGQSSQWETTYITDRASVLNTMPEIYGVPKSSVLQTIILSNLISSTFTSLPVSMVEIASVIVLAVILLLYFLPPSYFSRKRRQQSHDLSLISRELDSLKTKTDQYNETLQQRSRHSSQQHPQQSTPEQSNLQAPERVARHQALDKTAEQLKKSRKNITGKEEQPPAEKQPDNQ